jgi:hypothetical protein
VEKEKLEGKGELSTTRRELAGERRKTNYVKN